MTETKAKLGAKAGGRNDDWDGPPSSPEQKYLEIGSSFRDDSVCHRSCAIVARAANLAAIDLLASLLM